MTLTDRMKAAFPVRNECAFCCNMIYNSVPLELISFSQELLKLPLRSLRLSFTTESGLETEQVLRAAEDMLGPLLARARENSGLQQAGAGLPAALAGAEEEESASGSRSIGHRGLPEQVTRGHYRKGVE